MDSVYLGVYVMDSVYLGVHVMDMNIYRQDDGIHVRWKPGVTEKKGHMTVELRCLELRETGCEGGV